MEFPLYTRERILRRIPGRCRIRYTGLWLRYSLTIRAICCQVLAGVLAGGADKPEPVPQAAIGGIYLALLGGKMLFQHREQVSVHADMIDSHPFPEPGEAAMMEIYHHNNTVSSKIVTGDFDSVFPAGIKHGKGIREDHQVKGIVILQRLVVGSLNQFRRPGHVLEIFPCHAEHVSGQINTDNFSIGEMSAQGSQVRAGTATHFEYSSRLPDVSDTSAEIPPSKQETPAGSIVYPCMQPVISFDTTR